MSKVPLKFGPYYANVDEWAQTATTPELRDSFFLVNKATGERIWRRRPGMLEHIDLGTAKPVDGLYWWDQIGAMIAVSDGRVFKLTDNLGTKTELTGTGTPNKLARPTFATDGTNLIFANGGKIITTDGTSATTFLTDLDAPQACTHVAWLDTYFLANNVGSDKFNYSLVGNFPNDWNALDFDVAMTNPDATMALTVDIGEIIVAGKLSMEIYYNDGSSPFVRNSSATMNCGIGAAYSLIKAGGNWLWLNERREIVTPSGRNPQVISEPVANILQGYDTVSDCRADQFTIAGQVFVTFSFPTEQKTLVFNVTTKEWVGEWGYYTGGDYQQWLGNCYAYSTSWNQHMVGSRVDGKIYLMSDTYHDDDGTTVRSLLRTGHISHGTDNRKQCRCLTLQFKRGVIVGTPQIMIRWRDDGRSEWSNEVWRNVSAGAIGETQFLMRLWNCGTYRTRQYEIVMSAAAPLVFMGGWEDVTELGA